MNLESTFGKILCGHVFTYFPSTRKNISSLFYLGAKPDRIIWLDIWTGCGFHKRINCMRWPEIVLEIEQTKTEM